MKKSLILASVALIASSCTNSGPNQDDRNNPRNDRNNNNGCYADQNSQNYQNQNGNYNNGNYNNNNGYNTNDRMQDADMQTTDRVRNMLQNDSNIGGKGLYINAETTNGIVTITGDVQTRETSQYVERKVRSVKGVRGVDNQLSVSQ